MITYYVLVNEVLYKVSTMTSLEAVVKALLTYYKSSPLTVGLINNCEDMADIYQLDFDMQYWSSALELK